MNELEQIRNELKALAARYARASRWELVPEELDHAIAADTRLAELARGAREAMAPVIEKRLRSVVMPGAKHHAPILAGAFADAWVRTPRERFVLPEDLAISIDDEPVAIHPEGRATVSAPHAYFLTFGLLGLARGDHLLELGTGTGYGAALARWLVGPEGFVTTLEIDPILQARAARLLETRHHDEAPVLALFADGRAAAHAFESARPPNKIAYTYALTHEPEEVIASMPPGSVLVAPIGEREDQALVRIERPRDPDAPLERTKHGVVRYVPER